MYVCNKYLLLFMTIYFGVSLRQVHYQDWNVKNFFVPKHFSFPRIPQLAVLKHLLSFISNASGK